MQKTSIRYLSALLSAALLCGIAAANIIFRLPFEGAVDHHARVRQAIESIPYHIDGWVGTDVPPRPAAVRMLRPNVIVQRSYRNLISNRRVTLLLVHCTDARDLLGHYPPVCYVAHGWTQLDASRKEWLIDGLSIEGMQYTFGRERIGQVERLALINFMVLPDGQLVPDMVGVNRLAQHGRQKHYGAAQFQIVFDAHVRPEERESVFKMIIKANTSVLASLRRKGST